MSYTQPYSYHSAFFPPPGSSSSSSTTDDDSSPPLATGDLIEDATEADDLPGLGGSWGAAVESRDTHGGRADDCFLAGSVGGALRTKKVHAIPEIVHLFSPCPLRFVMGVVGPRNGTRRVRIGTVLPRHFGCCRSGMKRRGR